MTEQKEEEEEEEEEEEADPIMKFEILACAHTNVMLGLLSCF
jgi:hypothetical protein